jgi:multidrug efflux pump subunit AcrB
MLQRIAFAITIVCMGLCGGVLALFLRGMHAEWGPALGFCFVSALAIVQACIVANGVAEARRLNSNVRNACFRRTQAKFRNVFLVGLCPFVIVLPTALIGASSGAPARFASVISWYGVFHCRCVDCAACPHCADRGVKDTHGMSLLHRDEEDY